MGSKIGEKKKFYRCVEKGDESEKTKESSPGGCNDNGWKDERLANLKNFLELQKLRRQAPGLTATALCTAAGTKKKVNIERKDRLMSLDDVKEGRFGKNDPAFLTESNMMGSERLMEEYVENEFRKFRGEPLIEKGLAATTTKTSIEQEIIASIIKDNADNDGENDLEVNGGFNVSSSMLTTIPEVDLGLEPKLKNIEETEVAKKKLLEQKRTRKKDYVLEPFELKAHKKHSDGLDAIRRWTDHRYSSNKDQTHTRKWENFNLSPSKSASEDKTDNKKQIKRRGNMATDDYAVEKFRKRFRKN